MFYYLLLDWYKYLILHIVLLNIQCDMFHRYTKGIFRLIFNNIHLTLYTYIEYKYNWNFKFLYPCTCYYINYVYAYQMIVDACLFIRSVPIVNSRGYYYLLIFKNIWKVDKGGNPSNQLYFKGKSHCDHDNHKKIIIQIFVYCITRKA